MLPNRNTKIEDFIFHWCPPQRDKWGTDFRFRSDILSAFSSRLRLKRGYLSTPQNSFGISETKGFQKGAAALAGPLEIKTVEIFYVSFVALPQRLKAYLGAPRWEPNDRKRVRPDAVECPTRLDRTRLRSKRGAPKGQVGHWFTGLANLLCKFGTSVGSFTHN